MIECECCVVLCIVARMTWCGYYPLHVSLRTMHQKDAAFTPDPPVSKLIGKTDQLQLRLAPPGKSSIYLHYRIDTWMFLAPSNKSTHLPVLQI